MLYLLLLDISTPTTTLLVSPYRSVIKQSLRSFTVYFIFTNNCLSVCSALLPPTLPTGHSDNYWHLDYNWQLLSSIYWPKAVLNLSMSSLEHFRYRYVNFLHTRNKYSVFYQYFVIFFHVSGTNREGVEHVLILTYRNAFNYINYYHIGR